MNDKIYVTKSYLPDLQEYVDEISPMWESHWLTNIVPHWRHLASRKDMAR